MSQNTQTRCALTLDTSLSDSHHGKLRYCSLSMLGTFSNFSRTSHQITPELPHLCFHLYSSSIHPYRFPGHNCAPKFLVVDDVNTCKCWFSAITRVPAGENYVFDHSNWPAIKAESYHAIRWPSFSILLFTKFWAPCAAQEQCTEVSPHVHWTDAAV